jgi:hypothetical protein
MRLTVTTPTSTHIFDLSTTPSDATSALIIFTPLLTAVSFNFPTESTENIYSPTDLPQDYATIIQLVRFSFADPHRRINTISLVDHHIELAAHPDVLSPRLSSHNPRSSQALILSRTPPLATRNFSAPIRIPIRQSTPP